MFYSCCGDCGERWLIGDARTCKCPEEKAIKLGSHEVLRVTENGEFFWHPEADEMIEHGDFTSSPAMPHILRALRNAMKEKQ